MKTIRISITIILVTAMISILSLTAFATNTDFGSAAVDENEEYTLSEMLTYAIEDEYLAQAEYAQIISTYGAQTPFTNIKKAEATHISMLEPLFKEYDVTLPENTASLYTVVPSSLLEAYKTGVEAEIKNIAMYEAFLKQDLPHDVEAVFVALKNASEQHQSAFERGVDRASATSSNRQTRGRQ